MYMHEKPYITTTELAALLGVSRIAVFKKIQKGQIRAEKVGRAYRIARSNVPEILGASLTIQRRKQIDAAVQRVVREYGETLDLLARE
ncbi:MAG: excisionase family DNA-binding protein [bacterium]|nr:excisionase family DNA-binding protein [bacterium]